MLNHILAFSLKNRLLVLAAALAIVVWGGYQAQRLPVDVFPDLNRPTVTVLTELAETPALPPEDVELRVTLPLERLLNGAPGVQRVRSSSGVGLSIVWVEFDWDADVYRARQVVTEKLQLARGQLPRDANPIVLPVSSIMGEVMLIGVRATTGATHPEQRREQAMELRTLAEFTLRNRLQSVEGIAQVTVIGGVLKQYQVLTTPARLAAANVTLEQLTRAVEDASALAGGGVVLQSAKEGLVRFDGRALTLEDIGNTPVVWRDRRAVLIREVADVRFGGPVPRGDAAIWTRDQPDVSGPALILAVQKQPHANTLTLDRDLDTVLDEIQATLPAGVRLERHVFRQADFIRRAVDNVTEAMRDGAVWVFLLLLLFLGNLRTSLITLTALPLSVLITAIVFHVFGVSVNTMTLGGIAVAVGELVDDAVVDVENIFRRLRRGSASGVQGAVFGLGGALGTVFSASSEVRNSIVYATLIVCLVVTPLFALGGLEGRLFAPLGLAYIVSLMSSLAVSLTVTPVIASFLLPGSKSLGRRGDPLLLRALKWLDGYLVHFALRHARLVLGAVAVLVGLALYALTQMGGEFLPPFEEGTLTVNVQAEPGTSLAESNRLGQRVEDLLRQVPEVESVARRTGRAEGDEHAEGVYSSEIDVRLQDEERPKPGWLASVWRAMPGLRSRGVETMGRPRAEVRADIEKRLRALAGVKVNIGQPIAHRLDHVLSGVRAQVAVKLFGTDLGVLRGKAQDVQKELAGVPGVVDLQIEAQNEIPQVRFEFDRTKAKDYNLRPGDVARWVETAFQGRVAGQILDGEKRFDLVVWFDEEARADAAVLESAVLDTPSGRKVALGEVARRVDSTGPNQINHEQAQRRLVVSCNVRGHDLVSVVNEVRRRLQPVEEGLRQLGGPYRLEIGGQFAAQEQANRQLLLLGAAAVAGVFLLLFKALGSWRAAGQVLVNIPLAALGSVIALLLTSRPEWGQLSAAPWWSWPSLWLKTPTLSLAHGVGFITLIGIVSRNGILMISHYLHLMQHEGESFSEAMIVRGTLERLAPVLMTAGVAVIGLVPLAMGAGQPGKELLHPLAVVVIGGLIASTLLDQVVTPALFLLFGRKVYAGKNSDSVERG
jgi:CzcA family heavy metal efflux pump